MSRKSLGVGVGSRKTLGSRDGVQEDSSGGGVTQNGARKTIEGQHTGQCRATMEGIQKPSLAVSGC